MGGSIVTAGGLVFIGGSMDEKFHAYDKATGEVLWEAKLPAGGYATPATYEVDGRQYVVIAAGGGGKPGTRPGDAYVAFALPTSDADQEEASGAAMEETAASDGARLYETRCASCHQFNGKGVTGQFPPLLETEWVTGDKGRLIRIILGGISGEIEVDGVVYSGAMPPWGDFLSDTDVAAILTHVRTSWGNEASPISAEEVARVRAATEAKEGMWTADELAEDKNTGIPD